MHPDDIIDQRNRPHGLDRKRRLFHLWVTVLCASIIGPASWLLILWAIDGAPTFGKLNGCESHRSECAAFAEERP